MCERRVYPRAAPLLGRGGVRGRLGRGRLRARVRRARAPVPHAAAMRAAVTDTILYT